MNSMNAYDYVSNESVFNYIKKSFKKFTTERIESWDLIKPKLLKILEEYRPIRLFDRQFGVSLKRHENQRLIVFEFDDRTKVREYYYNINSWFCCMCKTKKLIAEHGIFFVKIEHNCAAREYSIVMAVQNFLKNSENNMKTTSYFLELQKLSKNVNIQNSDEAAEADTAEADTAEADTVEADTVESSSHLPQSNNEDEEDDCVILDVKPPVAKRPRMYQGQYFSFEKPSTSILKQMCAKFEMDYSNEAYKLWSKIDIDKIHLSPSSAKIQVHQFRSKNIFELFALLISGMSQNFFQIQYYINEAFYKEMKNSGKMSLRELDRAIMSTKLTGDHLTFICKFLPCRIVIFEADHLQRCGKWNQEEDNQCNLLTFVFACFNDVYSIVIKT